MQFVRVIGGVKIEAFFGFECGENQSFWRIEYSCLAEEGLPTRFYYFAELRHMVGNGRFALQFHFDRIAAGNFFDHLRARRQNRYNRGAQRETPDKNMATARRHLSSSALQLRDGDRINQNFRNDKGRHTVALPHFFDL